MKKFIRTLGVASIALVSAAAFAGKAPTVGSGGQGSGSTTTTAAINTAIAAVAGQSVGVSVATSPSGTVTISSSSPTALGGVTFAPTTVVVPNVGTFTVSASNGTIIMVPVAE